MAYPNTWYILENVPCECENDLHTDVVGWSALYMSARSSCFIVLFESSISSPIFCLDVPCVIEHEVLKSLVTIVQLP